jgi:hypothetical protein
MLKFISLTVALDTKQKLGMEAYICNPSTQRLRQKDCKFKASLGYRMRLYFNKKKRGREGEKGKGERGGGERGEREKETQSIPPS